MRIIFSLALLLLTSSSFASSLLILGDSLSAGYGIDVEKGWVNLLRDELGEDYTIINGSVSGDTTGGGLSRLPALLDAHKPDYVIIELGGNDGLRGYPLLTVKKNLRAMIDLSRRHGAEPILFDMVIPANYGKRYTEQFAALYPSLAEETDTPLVNFIMPELMGDKSMIQEDGIHPTEKAQPLITIKVNKSLAPLLKI